MAKFTEGTWRHNYETAIISAHTEEHGYIDQHHIAAIFGDATRDENYMNAECMNCGAQGATKLGEIQAAEAWNKRAGGGAINTELLAIVKNLAESNTYAGYKEHQYDARKLIQRIKH